MRYIQDGAQSAPSTKPEKDEPRTLAGNKDYDYSNLSSGKKIPTKDGWK